MVVNIYMVVLLRTRPRGELLCFVDSGRHACHLQCEITVPSVAVTGLTGRSPFLILGNATAAITVRRSQQQCTEHNAIQ